jgi:hypothetical protein
MKNKYLVFALLCFIVNTISASTPPPLKVNLYKFGPYIGLQRGAYTNIDFGVEYQLKELAFIKPTTQAVHGGFNYNLYNNVLGYELGYWMKKGRLNLTYGANFIFRTDFNRNAVGFAPLVGFKFMQFHLQTGYNLLFTQYPPKAVNGFFVSLRFVFIQNRNLDINK